MEKQPDKKEHNHEGHRSRMRAKLAMTENSDIFEQHEILEMALYATMPRSNTNEIAHELLKRFGSMAGVMDAPFAELLKISGVGETTATLLKLIPIFAKLYQEDKFAEKNRRMIINSTNIACEFLIAKYTDKVAEVPSAILMDSSCRLLAWSLVGNGTVNAAQLDIRKLVEQCVYYKASAVILAHNHPSGVALPSHEDLRTTQNVFSVLKALNIRLLDHIVVADGDCVSMADSAEYAFIFQ